MQATKTVRDIVIDDYRTADVFKKWGLNFCCGGNLPLKDACVARQISQWELEHDLQQATQNITLSNVIAFTEWPLCFLTDYIVYVHHHYLKQALPSLRQAMASFVPGHLKKYTHLGQVHKTFLHLASQLDEQMKEEEDNLFPYVKQISSTFNQREKYGSRFVRTMHKPLAKLIEESNGRMAALIEQLRVETDLYSFAPDACPNYRVIYKKLNELDADLVQHKHLENNILFPKALDMEKSLLQQ